MVKNALTGYAANQQLSAAMASGLRVQAVLGVEIVQPEPEPEEPTELPVVLSTLYWTDYGTDKIQCANLDGSGVEELVSSGLMAPDGIALDVAGGKMSVGSHGGGVEATRQIRSRAGKTETGSTACSKRPKVGFSDRF